MIDGFVNTVNGCNRKCPCRIWVSCPKYVDTHSQMMRLKYKNNWSENAKHMINMMSIDESMHDLFMG